MNHLIRRLGCALVAASFCQPFVALGEESWLERVLRITGVSVGPGQMRGPDAAGSLWVAAIDGAAPVRWTADDGFRSPIFAPANGGLYALRGDALVQIREPGAAPAVLQPAPAVTKLVGIDPQAPDALLVLMQDSTAPLAKLSISTGALKALPFDPAVPAQTDLLGQVRGVERRLGGTRVMLHKERREGLTRTSEWTEVQVQQGDARPRNLSQCDGANCAQPALAGDGSKVVFVRIEP